MPTILEKIEKRGESIIKYLSFFGENVKFMMPSENPHDYPGINLTTTEPLEETLKNHINKNLNFQNGYKSMLRFIAWGYKSNNKYFYIAEIVPINSQNLDYETELIEAEKFLHSMPKILKSITKQRCRKEHEKYQQSKNKR